MDNKKLDKKEIKSVVLTHIRAGKNYSEIKNLLEKDGIPYPALKTSFYKWKQELFPEEARQNALAAMKDKDKGKDKRTTLLWNSKRQKEADESVFADVVNEAVFYFVPCPQKRLTLEEVKKINIGGGIIGIVTYYTNINLNHPIIVFITRAILLLLKIRAMCFKIYEKAERLNHREAMSGI